MTWTALADLGHDIAGSLPADAFERWKDPSNRTAEVAAELLAPYARTGLVVCSDTAGLSKMTGQLPLAVVLKRIAEPKKHIHAAGIELGGTAIGIWVADNTEMFYPAPVAVDAVARAMAAVHTAGSLRVGFCLHYGTVYAIGGGLYGPAADLAEMLAEDHTRGGETLITPEARAALADPSQFRFTPKDEGALGTVFELVSDTTPPPPAACPTPYPLPYDEGMNTLLEQLDEANPETTLAAIDARYLSTVAVLLVRRHQRRPVKSVLETVEGLFDDVRFQEEVEPFLSEHCQHWTVSGSLALAAFQSSAEALDAAMAIRVRLAASGLVATMGIDQGPMYLFPMREGRYEFAGDAVNRASKIAEDLADAGALVISHRASKGVELGDTRQMRWTISGIAIDAHIVRSGPESET